MLEELNTKFNINQKNTIKKLNSKLFKNLNNKLIKQGRNTKETNEVFWLNKNEIEVARNKIDLNPIKIAIKSCLNCYTPFESVGIHNRLCDKCRKEST